MLLELQDVVDVGTAEAVDALRIVAHHADTLVAVGEQPYNLVLGVVGVLVLIYQHVLETVLVFLCHLGVLLKKEPGIEQKVVEVHYVALPATLEIVGIYLMNRRHAGSFVATACSGIGIDCRKDKVVLGLADVGGNG